MMISYIDLLGVNNLSSSKPKSRPTATNCKCAATYPGLTFRDYRAIVENVQGIQASTPRKRFKPTKVLPKTSQEPPQLIGVLPNFLEINSLKMLEGRFFSEEDNLTSAPVCVIGETAKVNLLGYEKAVGKFIKINSCGCR